MDYAIKQLKAKKSEINREIYRVNKMKHPNPKYKEEFDEGKRSDVALMNDKIKQLNRSINILIEFNT